MIDDKEYKQMLIEGIVHEKQRVGDEYKRHENIFNKFAQYGFVNVIVKAATVAVASSGVGTIPAIGVIASHYIAMYLLWTFRNSQDKCVKQCKSGTENNKCYWKCYNALEKRVITTIKKEINDTRKIKNPDNRKAIKYKLNNELTKWKEKEKESRDEIKNAVE